MKLSLLLVLAMAAPATASVPDEGVVTVPAANVPPTEPPARPSVAVTVAAVGLLEGLLVGYSALAAFHPEPVGWVQVLTSPFACLNGDAKTSVVVCGTASAEFAALGFYNAFELRSDGYSRAERFWRNFIGFHALFVSVAAADALLGRDGSKEKGGGDAAVSVAFAADATPLLVLAARF